MGLPAQDLGLEGDGPFVVLGSREDLGDDEWKRLRDTGIGASEVACLFGCGFVSALELWAHKSDVHSLPDLDGNEAVHWGSQLEPIIAREFGSARYAGLPVRLSGELLQSTDYPLVRATLDAWTEDPEHGWVPLEVKAANDFMARDWEDGTPERYVWQVQQQMLVTGAPVAYVACLLGGRELVWDKLEADDFRHRRIATEVEAFWDRVLNDDPPVPDHRDESRRVVSAMFPNDEKRTVHLSEWAANIVDELDEAKAKRTTLSKFIDATGNRIRQEMGAAEEGLLPDGSSFTLKKQTSAARTVAAKETRVLRRKKGKK